MIAEKWNILLKTQLLLKVLVVVNGYEFTVVSLHLNSSKTYTFRPKNLTYVFNSLTTTLNTLIFGHEEHQENQGLLKKMKYRSFCLINLR